jgi:hypothetical protein
MNFVNEEEKQENNFKNVSPTFDKTDYRVISLLVLGYDNKKISSTLKIPLSTIQRRTRRILQSGMVTLEYQTNFKMLDLKKGLLHTYLRDGQLRKTGEKISEMDGILSATIHVGNSDVVSEFVYNDNEELVDIIAAIKQIEGVERVMWSEEVFKLHTNKENVMKSFQKYWKENINYNNNGIRKIYNNNNQYNKEQ